MRSVVVVFPASMWAMMPMLRILSSGVVRAIVSCSGVGARHAVPIHSFSQQKRGATVTPFPREGGRSRSALVGRLSASSTQDPLAQGPEVVRQKVGARHALPVLTTGNARRPD